MDYYQLGQRIRRARKARGLSQEELAEKINISTTHMSHIETGGTKLSLAVFADLAAALEINADELLNSAADKGAEAYTSEISALLANCSSAEAKLIVDVIKAMKTALDKHF